MSLRWIGAICVLVGCGGAGFFFASRQVRLEKLLRQFLGVLEYMHSDLSYRRSSLPDLCRSAASQGRGEIFELFRLAADELEGQISPDAEHCLKAAAGKVSQLPEEIYRIIAQFGKSLGCFDASGQLKMLEKTQLMCNSLLRECMNNKDARIRSYKTLGICAGAAIVILFI